MNLKYLSIKSLIGLALQSSPDSDRYWDAVDALQNKASPDLVGVLNRLFASRNARKKLLAINVFSQLRYFRCRFSRWPLPYAVESAQAVIGAALCSGESSVLASAIAGAGHRPCMDWLPYLVRHVTSPDWLVRWELAVTLASYEHESSYAALMSLMRDEDEEVRNWATFSLGTQLKIDTEKIRSALLERLEDLDADVRGEAVNGLAARGDPRVIPVIARELQRADCTAYYLDAATELASPELLPMLLQRREELAQVEHASSYWRACLEDAIEACLAKVST